MGRVWVVREGVGEGGRVVREGEGGWVVREKVADLPWKKVADFAT